MKAIQGQDTLEGIIGASMRDDPEGTRQSILTGGAIGLPIAAAGGAMAAGMGGPLWGLIKYAAPWVGGEEIINHFEGAKSLYGLIRGAAH